MFVALKLPSSQPGSVGVGSGAGSGRRGQGAGSGGRGRCRSGGWGRAGAGEVWAGMSNPAPTVRLLRMVITQAAVPPHDPDQPVNRAPGAGVARSVSSLPFG